MLHQTSRQVKCFVFWSSDQSFFVLFCFLFKKVIKTDINIHRQMQTIWSNNYVRLHMIESICSNPFVRIHSFESICSNPFERLLLFKSVCSKSMRIENILTRMIIIKFQRFYFLNGS
jgi:hypothetical protein